MVPDGVQHLLIGHAALVRHPGRRQWAVQLDRLGGGKLVHGQAATPRFREPFVVRQSAVKVVAGDRQFHTRRRGVEQRRQFRPDRPGSRHVGLQSFGQRHKLSLDALQPRRQFARFFRSLGNQAIGPSFRPPVMCR